MTDSRFILTGLLLLQLGLALGLYWHRLEPDAGDLTPVPLLDAGARVAELRISDMQQEALLVLKDGQWRLPALADLPADGAKVEAALARLKRTATGWPVTTTAASHQRFEVAPDNYQRRLVLSAGGRPVELFLGTSPGFRKVHLRRAGEEAVYAVGLSAYELPADDNDWLDKEGLASESVDRIDGPDFTLVKQADAKPEEQAEVTGRDGASN
jgi:hypothetical protein